MTLWDIFIRKRLFGNYFAIFPAKSLWCIFYFVTLDKIANLL